MLFETDFTSTHKILRREGMDEKIWVALILVVGWASMPISVIIANMDFDKDVVKEGEDPFHH